MVYSQNGILLNSNKEQKECHIENIVKSRKYYVELKTNDINEYMYHMSPTILNLKVLKLLHRGKN